MTVDELIAELRALSEDGHGDLDVYIDEQWGRRIVMARYWADDDEPRIPGVRLPSAGHAVVIDTEDR